VRCLEPLLTGVEMFCGTEDGTHYCDGLFGAVSGHPAVKAAIDALPASMVEYGHLPINVQTGPGFTTRVWHGRSDVFVFPRETFYPYRWNEKHRKGETFPGAYAIHQDRKSTRLNSSHVKISYAVFCLKKKNVSQT